MTKIAAIIGAALLLAGVALAGTAVSLGASGTPTIASKLPVANVTARHEAEHARHPAHRDDGRHHNRQHGHDRRAADD